MEIVLTCFLLFSWKKVRLEENWLLDWQIPTFNHCGADCNLSTRIPSHSHPCWFHDWPAVLHFPAFLAIRTDHVTMFSPIHYERSMSAGAWTWRLLLYKGPQTTGDAKKELRRKVDPRMTLWSTAIVISLSLKPSLTYCAIWKSSPSWRASILHHLLWWQKSCARQKLHWSGNL